MIPFQNVDRICWRRQSQNATGVGCRHPRGLFLAPTAQGRHPRRNQAEIGRPVWLPAIRLGCHVGSIGLKDQGCSRDPADGFRKPPRVWKGHRPANAKDKAQINDFTGAFKAAGKGMKDSANPIGSFPVQQFQNPAGTASRMDQQRLVHLPGRPDHLDENLFLDVPGDSDLTIEPHLTQRDRPGVLQKTMQFRKVRLPAAVCGLRVDAGCGVNSGMRGGGRHQARPAVRCDPRHDPGGDSGVSGVLELGTKRVQLVQMDMRIYIACHGQQIVSQPIVGNQPL